MSPIDKKILTDEKMRPLAVQIDYDTWLEIERRRGLESLTTPETDAFDQVLEDMKGIRTEGDGLEYQRRIRKEWTRPWDLEAAEDDT